MHSRFTAALLLTYLATIATASPIQDNSETVHVTVTRTQYTCPCDASMTHAPHSHPTAPTSGSVKCYTHMKPGSVLSIPTGWATSYFECTSTSTSITTTTIVPEAETTTITSTETSTVTAPTDVSTDTITETDTATTLTITTTTETTTENETETDTATTTVTTAAGFLAVQSSLPGAAYDGTGGANPNVKRDAQTPPKNSGKSPLGLDLNPVSVWCHTSTTSSVCSPTVLTSTSTETASTSTILATITTTVTTTIVPSATTTITTTIMTTSTDSRTSTTTTTTTTTDTTTTTVSIFNACATNNLATQLNADTINGIFGGGTYDSVITSDQDSAYDCCAATFSDTSVAAQAFLFADGLCNYVYLEGENPGVAQADHQVKVNLNLADLPPAIVGNGPSGIINGVFQ